MNIINTNDIKKFCKTISSFFPEDKILLKQWCERNLKNHISKNETLFKKVLSTDEHMKMVNEYFAEEIPEWAEKAIKEKEAFWFDPTTNREFEEKCHFITEWMNENCSSWNENQISRITFDQADNLTTNWRKEKMNMKIREIARKTKKTEKEILSKMVEQDDEFMILWPDDEDGTKKIGTSTVGKNKFDVYQLFSKQSLEREGFLLDHCVGGYFSKVSNGNSKIFSIRTQKNKPLVTIEITPVHKERMYEVDQLFKKYCLPQIENITYEVSQCFGRSNLRPPAYMDEIARKILEPMNKDKRKPLTFIERIKIEEVIENIEDIIGNEKDVIKQKIQPKMKKIIKLVNHEKIKTTNEAKRKMLNILMPDEKDLNIKEEKKGKGVFIIGKTEINVPSSILSPSCRTIQSEFPDEIHEKMKNLAKKIINIIDNTTHTSIDITFSDETISTDQFFGYVGLYDEWRKTFENYKTRHKNHLTEINSKIRSFLKKNPEAEKREQMLNLLNTIIPQYMKKVEEIEPKKTKTPTHDRSQTYEKLMSFKR